MTHHVETSLLNCKANQLTGFHTIRAPTARYFRKDYNTILKKIKAKKKLDIRDYFLFPLSVVFGEIVHLSRKLTQHTWTIVRLRELDLPFKVFQSFMFLNFSGSISHIFGPKYDTLSARSVFYNWLRKLRDLSLIVRIFCFQLEYIVHYGWR